MKLNYGKTVRIGLAFLSICSFWQLYETVVPLILTRTFRTGDTLTGAVMALDNVLAIFLIPLFGSLSDKSPARLGRRTPFILWGTAVAVGAMLLLPLANRTGSFPLFVIALGVVLFAMAAYRSPAAALMADLTPAVLRSKANAVINLMGACGSMISLVLIGLLVPVTDRPDYTAVFFAVALVMVISVAVLVLTVRETATSKDTKDNPSGKEDPPGEKADGEIAQGMKKSLLLILFSVFFWYFAFNAVTTAFSRYAAGIWGLEGGRFAFLLIFPFAAAVAGYLPAGMIAAKIGRKKTVLAGVLLLTVSYLTESFLVSYSCLVPLGLIFIGAGWAFVNVNSYPMVVELCRGSEVGKFSGWYYSFSMSAQIITPILSGLLFEKFSYLILFPYAAFFSLCSLLTMLFVRHGEAGNTFPPGTQAEPEDTGAQV